MHTDTTYKVLQLSEWETLSQTGTFTGSPVDISDGFVHLSDAHQLQGTLDKHYRDNVPVIIAEICKSACGSELKHEISRGGQAFPHLYASLKLETVTRHWHVTPNPDGQYDISDILPRV